MKSIDVGYKIYLDMDGVLCDMVKRIEQLAGVPKHSLSKKEFWKTVYKDPEFFLNLEWMPGGKELWDYTKKYIPEVLTGLPGEKGAEHKRLWVARNMNPDLIVHVVPRVRKAEWAAPNHILIDDLPENIDRWIAAGGIGILHVNIDSTLCALKELGL